MHACWSLLVCPCCFVFFLFFFSPPNNFFFFFFFFPFFFPFFFSTPSIICRDSPGFVVNRILIPTLIQACLLVDAEIASVADIDTGMRLGAGWPMGVLHLADYVGIDTLHFAISGWRAEYPGEPAFVMPKCLDKLFREGKLGRKTGQGFYKWDGDRVVG
jgi:3-hydroxyacyl-CoA dehydrogenase